MSENLIPVFGCPSCGKRHPWRADIAGRAARCSCGVRFIVPAEAAEYAPDDGLAAPPPMARVAHAAQVEKRSTQAHNAPAAPARPAAARRVPPKQDVQEALLVPRQPPRVDLLASPDVTDDDEPIDLLPEDAIEPDAPHPTGGHKAPAPAAPPKAPRAAPAAPPPAAPDPDMIPFAADEPSSADVNAEADAIPELEPVAEEDAQPQPIDIFSEISDGDPGPDVLYDIADAVQPAPLPAPAAPPPPARPAPAHIDPTQGPGHATAAAPAVPNLPAGIVPPLPGKFAGDGRRFGTGAIVDDEPVRENNNVDLYSAMMLVPVGIWLSFVEAMQMGERPMTFGAAFPGVLITMILNVGLIYLAITIATMSVEGAAVDEPWWRVLLKVAAVALIPGPIGAMVGQSIGDINGNIASVFTSITLYFGIFFWLFRWPMAATGMVVLLVWVIRTGVMYGKFRVEGMLGDSWI